MKGIAVDITDVFSGNFMMSICMFVPIEICMSSIHVLFVGVNEVALTKLTEEY